LAVTSSVVKKCMGGNGWGRLALWLVGRK